MALNNVMKSPIFIEKIFIPTLVKRYTPIRDCINSKMYLILSFSPNIILLKNGANKIAIDVMKTEFEAVV